MSFATTAFAMLALAAVVMGGTLCPLNVHAVVSSTGTPVYQGSSFNAPINVLPLSCGSQSPQVVVQFLPPEEGGYTFDTTGSDFDTVMGLFVDYGTECAELDCNDDNPNGLLTSEISHGVADTIVYYVVVGGFNGAGGNVVINIEKQDDDPKGPTCLIDGTVFSIFYLTGHVHTTATDDPFLQPNVADFTCSNPDLVNPHPTASYHWAAPEQGTYRVSTMGSTMDTVLIRQDPETCGTLECNDDFDGLTSEITVTVAKDEEVFFAVGLFDPQTVGTIELHIELIFGGGMSIDIFFLNNNCNGPASFFVAGVDPFVPVVFVVSTNEAYDTIPAGLPCGGSSFPLDIDNMLGFKSTTSDFGGFAEIIVPNVPFCGTFMAAIDLSTCDSTDAIFVGPGN